MRLDELVRFEAPTSVSDGQGGREEGWTPMHTCRARFQNLRGGEVVQAARLAGQQPVVATVRKCAAMAGLNTSWIMHDERRSHVYNITSLVPSDNRLYIEITAVRGVAV